MIWLMNTTINIIAQPKWSQVKVKYVKSNTFIYFNVENNDKDPKFEVGNIKTVRNIKTVLKKVTLQIGLKKCLWLKIV